MTDYSSDIRSAVDVLRRGGIILYPTDTVWGLGCDATDSRAVARIFDIKQRNDAKALITLVGSLAQLERTVDGIPEVAYQLIEFSDKPLTIVYDRPLASAHIASELCAPDGTIGVRVTAEDFSSALCRAFGRPLVSTSANISGRPTPLSFSDIEKDICEAADYICTSRRDEAPANKPSTVMRLSHDGTFKVIRP